MEPILRVINHFSFQHYPFIFSFFSPGHLTNAAIGSYFLYSTIEIRVCIFFFRFIAGPKIIVRTEEVLIVVAVLLLWVAAIALFFNRWYNRSIWSSTIFFFQNLFSFSGVRFVCSNLINQSFNSNIDLRVHLSKWKRCHHLNIHHFLVFRWVVLFKCHPAESVPFRVRLDQIYTHVTRSEVSSILYVHCPITCRFSFLSMKILFQFFSFDEILNSMILFLSTKTQFEPLIWRIINKPSLFTAPPLYSRNRQNSVFVGPQFVAQKPSRKYQSAMDIHSLVLEEHTEAPEPV